PSSVKTFHGEAFVAEMSKTKDIAAKGPSDGDLAAGKISSERFHAESYVVETFTADDFAAVGLSAADFTAEAFAADDTDTMSEPSRLPDSASVVQNQEHSTEYFTAEAFAGDAADTMTGSRGPSDSASVLQGQDISTENFITENVAADNGDTMAGPSKRSNFAPVFQTLDFAADNGNTMTGPNRQSDSAPVIQNQVFSTANFIAEIFAAANAKIMGGSSKLPDSDFVVQNEDFSTGDFTANALVANNGNTMVGPSKRSDSAPVVQNTDFAADHGNTTVGPSRRSDSAPVAQNLNIYTADFAAEMFAAAYAKLMAESSKIPDSDFTFQNQDRFTEHFTAEIFTAEDADTIAGQSRLPNSASAVQNQDFYSEDFTTDAFIADDADTVAGPSRLSDQASIVQNQDLSTEDFAAAAFAIDTITGPSRLLNSTSVALNWGEMDQDLERQFQALPNLRPVRLNPLANLETDFNVLLAKAELANEVEAFRPTETVIAPKKLVVVCCLATWTGRIDTEDTWIAIPAQGKRRGWGMDMANPSERECWRMQICKGLEVLKEMDGEGILMFSGGPWLGKKNISAAKSYLDYAKASNFGGCLRDEKYVDYPSFLFLEERAMDSLQNIMFSLIEFNRKYKNFPEEMTVISYEIKRTRFETLHFKTAKEMILQSSQPETDVSWQGTPTFIGLDPLELRLPSKADKVKALMELEAHIFNVWRRSPFGLSDELMNRKEERNVWDIDLSYQLVFAGGAELVAALEKNAKEAPPTEEVVDMSVN
ncbi:hypothetical protein V493_07953, partial [Pseudogymnoascus sp. VKM F-4281 (FW-2241)]